MNITIEPAYVGYTAIDGSTYCGCPDCAAPVGIGDTPEEAAADLVEQCGELSVFQHCQEQPARCPDCRRLMILDRPCRCTRDEEE